MLLVVDLECSCWMGHPPEGMRQEVIEVGMCVVDAYLRKIVHQQSMLVIPQNSKVSPFCNEITGLTDEILNGDGSFMFADVHEMILDVVQRFRTTRMASWGPNDRDFMMRDCSHYGMVYPFPDHGMNVQKAFKKSMGLKQEVNLRRAMELLGLPNNGKFHRAGDDSYNTAEILLRIL